MMYLSKHGLLLLYISIARASFSLRKPGWLDKLVQYHKNKLFEDFTKLPVVSIKATIETAPTGYVDSPAWDFDSVIRLLSLIRQSESAAPVRRALRGMLVSRRMMSFKESLIAFPSLSKDLENYIYYDMDTGEEYGDLITEDSFTETSANKTLQDDDIIVVSNPVEAQLPSAMISVKLLREILESRAKAARYMPTTYRSISWKPMATTTAAALRQRINIPAKSPKTKASSTKRRARRLNANKKT